MTTSSRPLAIVTGASTGIGFELAKQFATNGFDLVVTAHSEALDDAVGSLEPRADGPPLAPGRPT